MSMDTALSLTSLVHHPLILTLPPPDPNWPDPDPNVLDEDSWHPPDRKRRTFVGYAAGPTLCRVGWMAFDPKTPAGNESEDTWASVDEAYERLPLPLAIETIILAHVALAHRIVWNIGQTVCPDALGREPHCASIAEDWFSMALLKMVRVVVGDRKRKGKKSQEEQEESETPDLRSVGRQHGWDNREVDAPKRIAKYLATAVRNEIWQAVNKEKKAAEHLLIYALKRECFYKGGKIIQGNEDKFHKAETVRGDRGQYVAYHEETPEKTLLERESFDVACDVACDDIYDRLILLMKRDGATQTRIGKELQLSRGQVQRRLKKIREIMQGDVRPTTKGKSKKPDGKSKKRAKKKAPSVIWDAVERRQWNTEALRDQGIAVNELNPSLTQDR